MTNQDNRTSRWTNDETRAAATWLDRDTARQAEWLEKARQCIEYAAEHPKVIDGSWTVNEAPLYELSQWLDEEALPSISDINPVWTDLAVLAYERIDWWEIANHYLSQVPHVGHGYMPFHPVYGQTDMSIDPLEGDQYVPASYGPEDE
jgi:hypothetical protein